MADAGVQPDRAVRVVVRTGAERAVRPDLYLRDVHQRDCLWGIDGEHLRAAAEAAGCGEAVQMSGVSVGTAGVLRDMRDVGSEYVA